MKSIAPAKHLSAWCASTGSMKGPSIRVTGQHSQVNTRSSNDLQRTGPGAGRHSGDGEDRSPTSGCSRDTARSATIGRPSRVRTPGKELTQVSVEQNLWHDADDRLLPLATAVSVALNGVNNQPATKDLTITRRSWKAGFPGDRERYVSGWTAAGLR